MSCACIFGCWNWWSVRKFYRFFFFFFFFFNFFRTSYPPIFNLATQKVTFTGGAGLSITSSNLNSLTGLIVDSTTGAVSGTVSTGATAGAQSISFLISDGALQTATATCPLNLLPAPTINCPQLWATTGVAYSSSFVVSASPAFVVSLTSTLPSGWTFTSGTLASPNPTSGSFVFNGRVVDKYGVIATRSCTVVVSVFPDFACAFSGNATVNSLYTANFALTSGAPATWSVPSVVPSSGFAGSFTSAQFRGTPTSPGSYTFTIQATETSTGRVVTKTCTITANALPTLPACPTYPRACAGAVYDAAGTTAITPTSVGAGPKVPTAFARTSGSLPTGLSVNGVTGAIQGTVATTATPGTYTFTITYTDASLKTAARTCSLIVDNVVFPCPVNNYAGATILSADVGKFFSARIVPTAGSGLTYTLSGLPSGLTWLLLNTSGFLVGTPANPNICGTGIQAPCSFQYTVTVNDPVNGCSYSTTCTMFVYTGPFYNCPTFPTIIANTTQIQSITFPPPVNGTGPFSFAITVTPAVSGATINPNGPLTATWNGILPTAGIYQFCVVVTGWFTFCVLSCFSFLVPNKMPSVLRLRNNVAILTCSLRWTLLVRRMVLAAKLTATRCCRRVVEELERTHGCHRLGEPLSL
jgi:hypothetical protein